MAFWLFKAVLKRTIFQSSRLFENILHWKCAVIRYRISERCLDYISYNGIVTMRLGHCHSSRKRARPAPFSSLYFSRFHLWNAMLVKRAVARSFAVCFREIILGSPASEASKILIIGNYIHVALRSTGIIFCQSGLVPETANIMLSNAALSQSYAKVNVRHGEVRHFIIIVTLSR